MKPKTVVVATDYQFALLWLMGNLESARVSEVMAAFEEEFGPIIPAEHREANESGRIKWEHYVAWSRLTLVQAGLMGSGGRGVWTITPTGQAWLRENPNASHADLAAFIKQGGAEAETGFQWRGERFSITKRALFSRARRLLEGDPPKEALRFKDWAVFVDDQPVSAKWLFALVTGADHNEFDSPTARRALSRIGIEAQQIDRAAKSALVPAQRPSRANRVERRDEFLAQVAELVSSDLSDQASHGEVRFVPGRNYVQLFHPEFPRSHYELRLATRFDEVAFHLEGDRDDNLARLAMLAPHQKEFTAALGHSVVAERWGDNWARLAINLPSASWTESQAQKYASLLARFVEATYPVIRQAFAAVPSRKKSRARQKPVSPDTPGGQAYAILDQQLAQIRTFLQGRSSRPSDEVLCDWVQFCYTFELFAEGYELFNLIVPAAVNDWLYGRTKKLAQVCRMRAQNKG
jgi:hypothetical protein